MLNFLASLKGGSTQKIVTYGVFASLDFGCDFSQVDEDWDYAGSPYEYLINTTKGKVYNLCKGNFGSDIADLGKDLVQKIESPYIILPTRPVVSTLKVIYKDKELLGGFNTEGGQWYYDFDVNRVVFRTLDFAPGDQEEVKVTYEEVN
jgi:hypothetical protein